MIRLYILRSSLRLALIVYRLIDAALIGNFFLIPSFFENEISTIREQMVPLGSNGLTFRLVARMPAFEV